MPREYVRETHDERSLQAAPVKPPFGYYGAKLRIASRIVKELPPHNAWVEGFCGSAAVTLGKPAAPIEVINDIDSQIVNVFQQLRTNSEALCRAVALTPYSREEHQRSRENVDGLDPLEQARRFLVRTMMTVNGAIAGDSSGFSFSNSFSRGEREPRVNRWYNLPERLEGVVERLRGVRVENRDALELVRMFADRPATLMYLDPPYFVQRRHGYAVDAKDEGFHETLLSECKKASCMLMISAYQTDLYEDLLRPEHGWLKSTIETQTRDTTGRDLARTEVLWTNARYEQARTSNRVPIRLTESENKERKLNPPRSR